MPSVRANGITLEFESLGKATDPAILLILGLALQLTAWPDGFCQTLASGGFRVIRFDNRDVGLSEKFPHLGTPKLGLEMVKYWLGAPVRAGYTLVDMARDTVGLLDALGIARAHLVGVSMGGMIAQIVASRFASRVLSLTSIMSSSGARGLPGPRWPVIKAFMSRPRGAGLQDLLDYYVYFFRVIGSPGFPVDEVELRASLERSMKRSFYPSGIARQWLAVLAGGDRSAELARIRAPALVIHGAADRLVPLAAGRDTARKIPRAKLVIVRGMGHDLAAWPILAREILAHVGGASAAGAVSPS
ncbi:MAG: alpha/beta hydrolase [Acetobacteraceae bacterium]|nr:alpha/beta hydrolase [Acetobacteraceae bacterium]